MRTGQRLLIPRAPSAPLLASTTRPAEPQRQAESVVAARTVSASEGDEDVQVLTHRVKRGDTLYGIANAYDVSVADLRAWNRMKSSRLDIGDRLTIRTARSQSRSAQ